MLSASFSTLITVSGCSDFPGRRFVPLLVGLPCGGSTNVPRQRLGFSIAHLTSRRGKAPLSRVEARAKEKNACPWSSEFGCD
jgi:hypothetical protein